MATRGWRVRGGSRHFLTCRQCAHRGINKTDKCTVNLEGTQIDKRMPASANLHINATMCRQKFKKSTYTVRLLQLTILSQTKLYNTRSYLFCDDGQRKKIYSRAHCVFSTLTLCRQAHRACINKTFRIYLNVLYRCS